MTYTAKAAVCSQIRTKHSTQSEQHVEFLNVKTWRYVKKPLGFERLMEMTRKVPACVPLISPRTDEILKQLIKSALILKCLANA